MTPREALSLQCGQRITKPDHRHGFPPQVGTVISKERTHLLVVWDQGFMGIEAMRCQKIGYRAHALKQIRKQ
jgi:hypothetical protein